MKIKTCRICNDELGIYARWNQVYCINPGCKKAGELARDRVNRQKQAMHRPMKKCRRCSRNFQMMEDGDRHYCKYCVAVTTKGEAKHKCMDCGMEISLLKKRCNICAPLAKEKQIEVRNKKIIDESKAINKEAKKKGITKENTGINPIFLEPQGSKRKGK